MATVVGLLMGFWEVLLKPLGPFHVQAVPPEADNRSGVPVQIGALLLAVRMGLATTLIVMLLLLVKLTSQPLASLTLCKVKLKVVSLIVSPTKATKSLSPVVLTGTGGNPEKEKVKV
jgi:hypothetical protein